MKLALFGLPACGKGTQAQRLSQDFGFVQLSTGDMLRRMAKDPGVIGEQLRALPPGAFADDNLVCQAVAQELKDPKYQQGVILDGFPRTLKQAQALTEMGITLDAVIYFKANTQELIARGVNRRVHPASGRIYNLISAPPKVAGVDDVTGEPLVWRDDDKEAVMQGRFDDFFSKTKPVVDYLKSLCLPGTGPVYTEIDAMQPANAVYDDVLTELATIRAIQGLRSGNLASSVTIESPYAGDVDKNVAYARAALRDCLLRGEAPIASHLLYTQPGVLDDLMPAQRRLGIEAGLVLAQMTAKTVVYTDLGMSQGMEEGVKRARAAGRPVEYRTLPELAASLNQAVTKPGLSESPLY